MGLHKKLSEDLNTKKGHIEEVDGRQITKEEYRQVAKNYWDGVKKAKAENELWLARDAKSSKKKNSLGICVTKGKENKQCLCYSMEMGKL